MFDAFKHHRRSVRLPHFDYGAGGAYFVTVCTAQKRAVFGRLENGAVLLHPYGKIVEEEWRRTEVLRPEIVLDEYIIMPDHFHAIVIITNPAQHDQPVGARLASPNGIIHPAIDAGREVLGEASLAPTGLAAKSLGAIIGGFKSGVTRRINAHRAERNSSPVVVWQRSFYERVIRDEKELLETRRYIIENPLHVEHL